MGQFYLALKTICDLEIVENHLNLCSSSPAIVGPNSSMELECGLVQSKQCPAEIWSRYCLYGRKIAEIWLKYD